MKKNRNIIRRIGSAVMAATLAFGVSAPMTVQAKTAYKVKKLKAVTLAVGKSKMVTVKSKAEVKWTTSNRKIAAVKSLGKSKAKVTAKKTGVATITGKSGSLKWTIKITVKKSKTVNLKAISLTVGSSKAVTANTKLKVKWTSSNKAVAAVKSTAKNKAKVTAKKVGTAIVTGKAGKTKWTAKVTVKKNGTDKSNKNSKNGKNNTTNSATDGKALLDKNIKALLHEIKADEGTSDIQKFARLCHWWSENITYGGEYKANKAIMAKYGKSFNMGEDYVGCIGAAYVYETREGVCGPQAEAFKYFGDLMGLKSITVYSYADYHEALHVYLDDGWYEFDPVFICKNPNNENNEPTSPCITYNEFINGTGKSYYKTILANALYLYPEGTTNSKGQTAEEIVYNRMYSLYHMDTYRVAKIYHEEKGEYFSAGSKCKNPSEHYGNKEKRDGPYEFGHTGVGYDKGKTGEVLDGKKYIDVVLADYL